MSTSRVWFAGGSEAGEEVESIVWCTGYQKEMSFLSSDCGLNISEEGHVVEPLYLHYINIHYPSMAVMHLNPGNVPFPQMDLQVMSDYEEAKKHDVTRFQPQARAFMKFHFCNILPSPFVLISNIFEVEL